MTVEESTDRKRMGERVGEQIATVAVWILFGAAAAIFLALAARLVIAILMF